MTALSMVVTSSLACAATIGAFLVAYQLQKGFGGTIWLQPILVAIMVLGGGVVAIGMSHDRFFAAAYPLHWFVGPMTALLAIPLYCQIRKIGSVAVPMLGILFVGSFSAMMSGAAAAITTGSMPPWRSPSPRNR